MPGQGCSLDAGQNWRVPSSTSSRFERFFRETKSWTTNRYRFDSGVLSIFWPTAKSGRDAYHRSKRRSITIPALAVHTRTYF
jgi:hypothetical protein